MTDVQLYVYDLSNGLARQMSMQFLGTQIDAVYHTSIVMKGVEYFFGAGIQMSYAGQTHHGRPLETIPLGQTDLPEDIILDYLNSLKDTYTPESYDLFMHNCNNFSNDLAMFLVGRGIPDKITSLPKTVLDTPFGQMLRPQLDKSLRTVTQAPIAPSSTPNGLPSAINNRGSLSAAPSANATNTITGVRNLTSLTLIESILKASPAAVIFFTSSTCAPCRICYPVFDELADEAGTKCAFIKVDIDKPDAHAIASKYSVRATPTFMTFLKGKKQDEWAGADPSRLRGTVRLLLQTAFPPHPHETLRLPQFLRASRSPVLYTKVPPLEKLTAKLGSKSVSAQIAVDFISARNAGEAKDAPLPDLTALGSLFRAYKEELPTEVLFAAYDLFRLVLVDHRAAAFFAEPHSALLISQLLSHVNDLSACPYNLRLVSIHLACNLFSSPVARQAIPRNSTLCEVLTTLVANSLLDKEHTNLRVAATSLAYNLTTVEFESKLIKDASVLPESVQIELAAALVEALSTETESPESARGMAVSLGRMVYKADLEGELCGTCSALEASRAVTGKESLVGKNEAALVKEIGENLLGKGLES